MFKNKGLLMRIALVLTISLIMNQTYIVNASEDILLADAVSYGELLGDDSAQEAELLADEPADELITETPAEKNNEELIPEPIAETMEILADKAPSESENNIASGKVGNVTWVIGEDGKLTVEGTGEYLDGNGLAPWYDYRDEIISAEINMSDTEDLGCLLWDCTKLVSVDLAGLDTSNATNMSLMFAGCNSLESIDLSRFDTMKVTDMRDMFNCCHKIKELDLRGFDTSKVTDMSNMFVSCDGLEVVYLTGFNTSQVTQMYNLFSGCESLKALDLSSFDMSKVTNTIDMFTSCDLLTSIKVPRNLKVNIGLPATFVKKSDPSVEYTKLPQDVTTSFEIIRKDTLSRNVTGIEVTPISKDIYIGDSFQLSVNVLPADAADKTVTWTNNNPLIVTVDPTTGVVKGIKAGSATITVKTSDGVYAATCTVTVREKSVEAQSIEVTPSEIQIYIGESAKLTAKIIPSDASDKTITWSSDDEKVAVVSANGIVTAKGVGFSSVRAKTSNGLEAKCAVEVVKAPVRVTGVSVSPNSVTMEVGDSFYIRATVSPADADDKTVTYKMSSGSGDIISLGNDGKVTALKEGSAVVTVVTNDGNYEANCYVSVNKAPTPTPTPTPTPRPTPTPKPTPTPEPEEEQEVDNTETDVEHKEEIDFEVEDQDGYLKLHVEDAKAPGLRVQIYNDPVLKTYPKVRCFDIYLEDEQKRRIKNFGRCTIWIPLDADMDPSNGIAVVTTGEDGRTESLPATAVLKNGVMCAKFETTHFTYFAILCGDFIHDTLNEDTTPIGGKSNTTTRSSSSSTSTTSSSSTTGRSSNSSSTTDILKMVTQSSSPTPAYGSANSAATAANSTDRTGGKSGSNGSSRTKDSVPKTGDRKWLE